MRNTENEVMRYRWSEVGKRQVREGTKNTGRSEKHTKGGTEKQNT